MKYQLYELEPFDGMPSAWMVTNEWDNFRTINKDEVHERAKVTTFQNLSSNVINLLTYTIENVGSEQATYLGTFNNLEEITQEIKMRSLLES